MSSMFTFNNNSRLRKTECTEIRERVYKALSRTCLTVDEICERLSISKSVAQRQLQRLRVVGRAGVVGKKRSAGGGMKLVFGVGPMYRRVARPASVAFAGPAIRGYRW